MVSKKNKKKFAFQTHNLLDCAAGSLRCGSGSSAPSRPAGPELWERAKWITWLGTNVSLFKSLTEQEVADVFDNSTECYMVDGGTSVVEQGEDGTSMFVLVQGELNVFITNPEVNRGQPLLVTVLGAGQFFGEMSLLTGELRAATVSASERGNACYVLEVSQEGLQPVLARRPNLATALGEVVAERRVKNYDSYREAPEETRRQRRTSMVGRVMASVNKTIFGGGSGGGGSPGGGDNASGGGGDGPPKLVRQSSTAGARWSQQQQNLALASATSSPALSLGSPGVVGARGARSSTGMMGAMGGGKVPAPTRKTSR